MDHQKTNSPATSEAAPVEAASIFTRYKFEIKRRSLTVTSKEYITPKMIRISASGSDLHDFNSMAPDDHLKLVIPSQDEKPQMRDYTPRAFDAQKGTLVVDFAVHEAGPATQWAIDVQVGDEMLIGGPRGSSALSEAFDWMILIGDETALPAMGRWLEEANAEQRITTLGIVTDEAEQQVWQTKAQHNSLWAYRPAQDDTSPDAPLKVLQTMDRPLGKGFIWVGAEANVARGLKQFFLNEWQHPAQHLKSSGYWVKGMADTTEK